MRVPCTQNRGHIKNKNRDVINHFKLYTKSEAKKCDKQQILCEYKSILVCLNVSN
jgi:hypothetical protein